MQHTHKYGLIVIGGSHGGFEGMIRIVSSLPPTFTVPMALVLHRPKNDNNSLSKLLQHYTPLKVKEPEDKERIQPGHIYVAGANLHLMVEKEKHFSYCSSELVNYSRPSIDVLFETAAIAFAAQLIGVLLSGANSDGAAGLRQVKALDGTTIIEDPEAARSAYMPQAAARLIKPDYILKPADIAQQLIALTA